jgi:hypothetical protein
MILNDLRFDFHGHFENQISNQTPYFNIILKISKSSQNDLKSDFVKSSIKSLNTLQIILPKTLGILLPSSDIRMAWMRAARARFAKSLIFRRPA